MPLRTFAIPSGARRDVSRDPHPPDSITLLNRLCTGRRPILRHGNDDLAPVDGSALVHPEVAGPPARERVRRHVIGPDERGRGVPEAAPLHETTPGVTAMR